MTEKSIWRRLFGGNADPFDSQQELARGAEHHRAGRLDEAEEAYRLVLHHDPTCADATHLLGIIASQKGDEALAHRLITAAATGSPTNPHYRISLGDSWRRAGRLDEAIVEFDAALTAAPELPVALFKRAECHCAKGQFAEAVDVYDRGLQFEPGNANALDNRGFALQQLKRPDEALASYDRSLASDPSSASALNNRGSVLQEMNRLDEAIASYNAALDLAPNYAAALANRGVTLWELGRSAEARADFVKALDLAPGDAKAAWNYSCLLLAMGELERGFAYYEARWQLFSGTDRGFSEPQWQGEDLRGKTILVHAEQGLGDTLQFARYASVLVGLGAKVLLEAQPPLRSLLLGFETTFAGACRIVNRGEALPDFDVHCPLLSLPRVLGTTLASIPSTVPYLMVPQKQRERWQRRLAEWSGKPRVGLTWSGNPSHPNDRNRSIPLATLAPLLEVDAHFFSLQTEIRDRDKATLDASNLVHFGGELNDFADTAALASEMDLVISVDTSVAHLAGGLGCPVWTLLTYTADWRWLRDRTDSPWYPTMQIVRQRLRGEWESVIGNLRNDLESRFFDR